MRAAAYCDAVLSTPHLPQAVANPRVFHEAMPDMPTATDPSGEDWQACMASQKESLEGSGAILAELRSRSFIAGNCAWDTRFRTLLASRPKLGLRTIFRKFSGGVRMEASAMLPPVRSRRILRTSYALSANTSRTSSSPRLRPSCLIDSPYPGDYPFEKRHDNDPRDPFVLYSAVTTALD
jgi:hypothetical protein